MLNVFDKDIPLLNETSLWTGLDYLDIGLFMLNRDGYVIRHNNAAGRIFGVDAEAAFSELHISKVDCILSTGLTGELDSILYGNKHFIRKDITCTNSTGMYLVVDLYCQAVPGNDGSGDYVLGMVEDVNARRRRCQGETGQLPQLQILSTVASALSSSIDLGEILKVILTGATASQGLSFNRAFLFLYNEAANRLEGHLAVGPSSAEEAGYIWHNLESKDLSLDQVLDVGRRESKKKADSVNHLISNLSFDLSDDSLISKLCSRIAWINLDNTAHLDDRTATFLDRMGSRKMALVPMVAKGNLMGLLAADNFITGRPISDEAVQLLQILANQAAVAMERSRLYEDQVERTTQLERMNALLAETQDRIIEIEKMSIIGELTAAIAHELRNPLTVIGGFANLMLKGQVTDEQREYLNIIASETRRSESVLDHVLDFSKASKGESRNIELSELVSKNLSLLSGRLRRLDLNITLSQAPHSITVRGNYDQLSHAFYQFFKLVAEDLIPPGRAEIRTEQHDGKALMLIRIVVDEVVREKTIRALRQIFTDNKTSQRLTILVAGETIRYHGGNFGITFGSDGIPSLYVELPVSKEA